MSDMADTRPPSTGDAVGGAAAASPSGRRRFRAPGIPTALVALAACGGLVATLIMIHSADRTAPAVYWPPAQERPTSAPATTSGSRGERTDTELARTLLPVPGEYRLGPDVAPYGNDEELEGRRFTTILAASGSGLSGKQRRERDKEFRELRIKGFAVRSYAALNSDLVIEMQVLRMENRKAVQRVFAVQKALFESVGVFRSGPGVEGFPNATCYLWPEDKRAKLDRMTCLAVHGELVVTARAYGPSPFRSGAVVQLLQQQLSRINPGQPA
ncbi:hypothetical protein ACF1G0_33055 [Streptomyces sp. NPDC013953]|uniref:hypothetical protein n=1 Tax=Streptomyces sp. NPDC013953 TaxID=3364868 RepID=UPI0036FB6A7E